MARSTKEVHTVGENKVCSGCSESKDLSCFYKSATCKTHDPKCKICRTASNKQSIKKRAGQRALANAVWALANPQKVCVTCNEPKDLSLFGKSSRNKGGVVPSCKECKNLQTRKWAKDNPEKARTAIQKWNDLNLERKRAVQAEYRKSNSKSIREWERNALATNVGYKLRRNLRQRIRAALGGNTKVGSAVRDLGCDVDQFRSYIASLFQPGMTWENYGPRVGQWNIDHIMPLSKFDLQDKQHFILACHYLNLRPLWVIENMKKNTKIPTEFMKAA